MAGPIKKNFFTRGLNTIGISSRDIQHMIDDLNFFGLSSSDDNNNENVMTGVAPQPSFNTSGQLMSKFRDRMARTVGVKTLPRNRAYRVTDAREIDDIIKTGQLREIPDDVVLPRYTVTTKSGFTFDFGRPKGRSHGGKSLAKGVDWRSSGGSIANKNGNYVIGIKDKAAPYKVGYHGSYSKPVNFGEIEHGKPIHVSFDENGVAPISTKNANIYKKENGRYLLFKHL